MYTVASSRLDSLLSSSVNGFAKRALVKSEVTVLTMRTKSTPYSFAASLLDIVSFYSVLCAHAG